ncbi:MAG TPA: cation diffusion facilitator family transporter [Acidimicrobiales bacterium]|nr:cation diffusion facilitator family transporter [Acidimicrobiales bacterium]
MTVERSVGAMEGGSRKAIVAAFAANLGIAIAKFVGFAFTGAASMLAEAVHSMADTANQALLLLGGRRARRSPTADHPFGYGRERYFWAFVVALVLFTLGSMFALFEGVEKLRHPHELSSPGWAVGILGLAIILESLSFRTALRESRAVKGPGSWWAFVRRSKIPELPVVLLEDLGALVGLTIALAGVGMAELTGNPRWDATGSVAIGLLLGVIACVLVVEMKSLLIGESADSGQQAAIRAAITAGPHVRRIIHLRTQHLGPDELLVGAKIELDADLSFAGVASAIDTVEAQVRAAVPAARVMYIEPDVYRESSGPSSSADDGLANR